MGQLNTVKVKALGPGRHADGDGLHLLVKDSGARSWMLRIQADGRRRDLGLGSVDLSSRTREAALAAERIPIIKRRILTLAEARDKADAYRKMIKAGIDPVAERDKVAIKVPTFEKAARDCHAELKAGWRNKKHTDSWLASLENNVFPTIGDKPVGEITSIAVRDVLAPIWLKMPETAKRILQRIGAVLDFAHIKGWQPTETSLRSVRKGLPRQRARESHFHAMPYADVPDYFQKLVVSGETVGRLALRFTVLTAVRSNETRFAKWPEVDLQRKIWTIPAERMKMHETHIVPLSDAAIAILHQRWRARSADDGLVFFSRAGKAISDMTMTKVLRDDDIADVTVHGFRSSFTDWAAESTEFAKEVVDKALAHKLPDKVEAAYRRTDFFEKRRRLMDDWAAYLSVTSVNQQAQ